MLMMLLSTLFSGDDDDDDDKSKEQTNHKHEVDELEDDSFNLLSSELFVLILLGVIAVIFIGNLVIGKL